MTHWHLESLNWLDKLPDQAVQKLRSASSVLKLKDGETVFDPSSSQSDVYLLEKGLIRLYRLSQYGEELTLGFVEPGEVFGELALLGTRPRESFAVAIDNCTILRCPKNIFLELIKTTSKLSFKVSKQLAKRLERIETRAEDLVFKTVTSRLAKILLMLGADYGTEAGGELFIDLHLTQTELASLIGSSRPSVNIALSKFKEERLIVFRDGHISILNSEGLQKIAQKQRY